MTTLSLFVCAPAGQNVDGSCTSGQGAWQNVLLSEPFDPSQLNTVELRDALSSGFTVLGTFLVMVWGGRQLLVAIKRARR